MDHNKNQGEVGKDLTTQPTESPRPALESFRDRVLEESRKGNVVLADFEGYHIAPLEEFIKQPADGILYDLNRLPEVVLTFIDDPKWINDFAAQAVIKRLREQVNHWQSIETAPKDGTRIIVAHGGAKVAHKYGRVPINIVRWMRARHGSNTNQRKSWFLAQGVELRYAPTHWMPLLALMASLPHNDAERETESDQG